MTRQWNASWSVSAWGFGLPVAAIAWATITDPIAARASAIAGLCPTLWLTEVVPPFAPTLLLLAAVPLLLTPYTDLSTVWGRC